MCWQARARPSRPLAFYMGMGRMPPIFGDMLRPALPAPTPAALVEQSPLPGRRCVSATLRKLPALAAAHGIRPPALVVIGEVVALQPHIFRGLHAGVV